MGAVGAWWAVAIAETGHLLTLTLQLSTFDLCSCLLHACRLFNGVVMVSMLGSA